MPGEFSEAVFDGGGAVLDGDPQGCFGVSSNKKQEHRKGEMLQNWYSMTDSEIYPLTCADGVSEEALAIVIAKLCHQA